MEALKSPPELSLSLNPAEDWRRWKDKYELFAEACGATALPVARQRATFLHLIGEEGQALYKTFEFTRMENGVPQQMTGDELTIPAILQKFDGHFKPYLNITYIRYQFNTCEQGSRPFDEYYTELKLKSKDCEFGEARDSIIRDRIVCGISDHNLRERLLREANLDLAKTAQICRAAEMSRAQVKLMKGNGGKQEEMKEIQQLTARWDVKKQGGKTGHTRPKIETQQFRQIKQPCGWCGGQHPPRACPAYGKTCMKCNKQNHFAKVCQQRVMHELRTVDSNEANGQEHYATTQDSEDESDILFLGLLSLANEAKIHDDWTEEILIHNTAITFKIDTGAQADVIPWSVIKKLYPKVNLEPTKAILVAYTGQKIIPRGRCTLKAFYKGKLIEIKPMVADIEAQPILGLRTCENLGIVTRVRMEELSEETCRDKLAEKPETIIGEYEDVFKGIGEFRGEHDFILDPMAKPTVVNPRRIPYALQPAVKDELKRMENLGIIKKVKKPTDWSHQMVIVHKVGGGLRICIDPQHLNANIKTKQLQMPTCEEIIAKLEGATYFTVLDANLAFWHKKLTEQSSYMCTMATPYGNFRFLRLPFGVKTGPEVFQEEMNNIYGDEEGIAPYEDDIIIWGKDMPEHNKRLRRALQLARENNLRLKKQKMQLAKTEVKYLGHMITAKGVKPDPEKVETVKSFLEPKSKRELQQLLGLLTYLGKFIPNLSEDTAYMRKLLTLDKWGWTKKATEDLEKVKGKLLNAPVLQYYNPKTPIQVYVDASQNGLGAVLVQEKPITFASTTLTETQKRYAQIEKEMLAILFGCTRFHTYVYGHEFLILTDHKPLVTIMGKPLDRISPRLQRIRLRLQRYTFKLEYIPGKEMGAADTLSRIPNENKMMSTTEDDYQILEMVKTFPASDTMKEKIRQETRADTEMQAVIQTVKQGWPHSKKETDATIREYWQIKEDLHYVDGILCKGTAIVIPLALRREVLKTIHETHQGIGQTRRRYQDTVYWPGIAKQVDVMVKSCHYCQTYQRANQTEPMASHPIPERPWQKVGMDFCETPQCKYLLLTDYLSKYTEAVQMTKTRAQDLIIALKSINARHGIPTEMISDGGPPFNSKELSDYMKEWGIDHHITSPHYPRSNGMIERHIQTVKTQLKKTLEAGGDPYLCLLNLRATPSDGFQSPAEILMGRKLRTRLPQMDSLLNPRQVNFDKLKTTLKAKQDKQKQYADKQAKHLPSLKTNQWVYMKTPRKWIPARVAGTAMEPNSYIVKATNGGTYRRNRWHLKPAHPETKLPQTEVQHSQDPYLDEPATGQEDILVSSAAPEATTDKTLRTFAESTTDRPSSQKQPETDHRQTQSGRVIKRPAWMKDFH